MCNCVGGMKKTRLGKWLALTIMLPILIFGVTVLAFIANPRAITSVFFGVNTEPISLPILSTFEPKVPDEKTRKIVTATKAFLATLDRAQLEEIMFEFGDHRQRTNWSNFPEGMIPRGGLKLGKLSPNQRGLLDDILKQLLSDRGFENIQRQLETEDTLTQLPFMKYGSSHFYVAILGEPTMSLPWMLQFGGHHLAINATIYGADLSLSPMLTGGQPLHLSSLGSASIVDDEILALKAFIESLTAEQRAMANVSIVIADLQHGPGKFGRKADRQGISGEALSPSQKRLLLNLVSSRVTFINEDDYAATMKSVENQIDSTMFGIWGQLDKFGFAYYRIVGPTVLIEYAPQIEGENDQRVEHLHSIYRNPSNDYGFGMGITGIR